MGKTFIVMLLIISVLASMISFTCQEKQKKRYNPYKTKEKIEQEEEFDEPELLDSSVSASEETTDDLEVTETSNKEAEKDEEEMKYTGEKIEHSEELEFEASRHKLFLQLFTIYEVLMMIFVFIFIFVCLVGKSKNSRLAAAWYANNKQFFVNNYAHIGTETQYNADAPIFNESYNNFKFYASGRVNVNSNLVSLDLVKRQDLVSYITGLFFPMEKDRIIYDISINSSDIPHVFCICRKKDIKFMKKTYPDIDFMTRGYEADFINTKITSGTSNKSLLLLTEDDEVIDKLFDRTLRNLYEQVEKNIDIIYFTDRQSYSKEKFSIFCSFYVDNMKNSLLITKFVHALVDKLANLEFNSRRKANAEKLRKEYAEHLDRLTQKKLQNSEEEQDKRAQEAQKKADAQAKKLLTKEQMMKLEEKERKEKLKKQQKKYMKVVK